MSRRMTRATADSLSSTSTQLSSSNYIAPSTVMYINSQCNHPAFNKLYLGPNLSPKGKLLVTASAVPKPPKPPEKPLMPYLRYSKKVWDDVKASQPDLKLWEVGKIIGKMWRELPSSDKQLYIDESETEKAEYQDLLKSYHNSPAYQGYLQAKGRAEAIEAENRALERDGSMMSIEPADDGSGDTDEGFSVKHVSAARFQRNHRLMQNILLDTTVVPSSRGIVTEQRLEVLRNQVQSLEHHQKKLEAELGNIENNHIATKRKWKESTSKFIVELKRLRDMTPQEYHAQHQKKQQALKLQAQAEVAEKAAQEKNNKTEVEETPNLSSSSGVAPEANEENKSIVEDQQPFAEVVDNNESTKPADADINTTTDAATNKEPAADVQPEEEKLIEADQQDHEEVEKDMLPNETNTLQSPKEADAPASTENAETVVESSSEKMDDCKMEE